MDLKERTERLRDFGEAHRPSFRFRDDSVVYKIYNWWCDETGYTTARENSCHFFWTVALFAPLLFLGKVVNKSALRTNTIIGVLFAAMLLVEQLAIMAGHWLAPLVTYGIIAGIIGFLAGLVLFIECFDEHGSYFKSIRALKNSDHVGARYGVLLLLATLPASWLTYNLFRVINAAGNSRYADAVAFVGMSVATLTLLGIVVSLFASAFMEGMQMSMFWATMVAIGSLIAFGAAIFALGWICMMIGRGWRNTTRGARNKRNERRARRPVVERAEPTGPSVASKAFTPFATAGRAVRDLLILLWTGLVVVKRIGSCWYIDVPRHMAAEETNS